MFGVAQLEEGTEYFAAFRCGEEIADIAVDEAFDFVAGQFATVAETAKDARGGWTVAGCRSLGCFKSIYKSS